MTRTKVTVEQVKAKLTDGSIRPYWGPLAARLSDEERAAVIADAINSSVLTPEAPRSRQPTVDVTRIEYSHSLRITHHG